MINILKYYIPSDDYQSDLVLIKAHFVAQGFKVQTTDDSTVFTKGNIVRNHITMNPLSWKSEHLVRLVNKKIEIRSSIHDLSQEISDFEIRAWHSFLDSIESILTSRTIDNTSLKKARRENQKHNFIYFSCLIGGLILGGIIVLFLADANLIHEFLIEPLVIIGPLISHFVYYKWLEYDRNKRFG